MEWLLKDFDEVHVYIDDVIIGLSGETMEECVMDHDRKLRSVLDRCKEHTMIVNGEKTHMFLEEVQFCGHVLREGKRTPARDKLSAIRKLQLPNTITQLRVYLGL